MRRPLRCEPAGARAPVGNDRTGRGVLAVTVLCLWSSSAVLIFYTFTEQVIPRKPITQLSKADDTDVALLGHLLLVARKVGFKKCLVWLEFVFGSARRDVRIMCCSRHLILRSPRSKSLTTASELSSMMARTAARAFVSPSFLVSFKRPPLALKNCPSRLISSQTTFTSTFSAAARWNGLPANAFALPIS
jgi:hypothetical protein